MKLILATFITINLISTAAMAFEITGGSFVLSQNMVNYTSGLQRSYGQTDTQGSVAFSLGNGFGGQAGLSFGTDSQEADYISGEVHLTYAVSPDVILGAFIGKYDIDFGDFGGSAGLLKYEFFGVEAAYTKNAFSVQTALVSEIDLNGGGYSHKAIVIDAVYGLTEKVNIIGGLHVLTYTLENVNTFQYIYLGAAFTITPKIDVNVTYGKMSEVNYFATRQLSLNLTYKFRKPTLFQQRVTNTILPGI
jgi:hypothetical protein